ncbi:DUF4176 domain-containing protein [Enterococcus sp. DIV2381]|uniref:DUF4176 domain-containing protein n=1 Tax=unclassified Enterococcus TaxID=2608891 RepID=UPI003D27AC9C
MKKLFNATFEQSLKLLDDPLVDYMIKDTEKRGLYNGKKRFLLMSISIILIMAQYGFVKITEFGMKSPDRNSFVPEPDINFLPESFFWILLFIYLSIWLYTRYKNKNNASTKIFITMNTCNNYLIWLILTINLFFITLSLNVLTSIGMIIVLLLLTIVGYIVIRSKYNSLNIKMLNIKNKEKNKLDDFIEKIIKIVMSYGWIVVIIVMIWKFIFPSGDTPRTDMIGFINIFAMWIAFNIAVMVAEAYLFFPYLLHGYYKHKYSEEYRNLEGQTQLEWYGEKYFNKHIKGTDKEEIHNE